MQGNNAIIEVENLRKSYLMGRAFVEVLKGVNLSIKKGEFVMIVGPSGSGKSTLLHLLGGLDRPTEGQVRVLDHALSRASDRVLSRIRNRSLGFIFQFYHLMNEFSAYENVCLPGLIQGGISRRRALERADALLARVGLSHRKTHRPNELSGGEQQRLAVARALINDPPILLADEPTGNLDTENGNAVLDLLEALHRERGLTVVMVTHNPDFLKRAQRVLYLKDGKIAE